ncbi:MAG TPA: hypothetical protein VLG47_02000 [Candidatus Saccharimonadales bacterium]|nr:hypothetical protein [Candidatus Saccharimonadales bacterium]
MAKKSKASGVEKIYRFTIRLLSSNGFFYGVIAITIIQALWYAFSFQPTILDEGEHVGFIAAYAHQLSPFITHQSPMYDYLGEITRSPSYLFYYLMSLPWHLVSFFTQSIYAHIIFLRLICVAMFTGGIIYYRKLLLAVGATKAIASMVLLFVVLTPTFSVLGGAVNYDNAVFLLAPVLLLLALAEIRSKEVNVTRLALIVSICLLGSLIKFEYLAFSIPLIIYLLIDISMKHRSRLLPGIKKSFVGLSIWAKVGVIVLLVISAGLFIERPVYNEYKYHAVDPTCTSLISKDRCMKNYTAARTIKAIDSKPAAFSPVGPFDYTLAQWIPGMVVTQTILLPGHQPPFKLLRQLYYLGAIGGGILVLVYLRDFLKNKAWRMLLITTAGYAFILAVYNYSAYLRLGIPVAITGRYLLPVLPIFIFFVALSILKLFRYSKPAILIFLAFSILIFTQGGGMITYVLAQNSSYYWPGSFIYNLNTTLREIADPVVKQG